jgi:dimethylargininase
MHFNQAIARLPAATCAAGQTTARLGAPDIAGTTRQFLAYVETLLQLGLKVTVLPAAADYPDAHFVEDTAVVMPELAVITHPGAPSRQGSGLDSAGAGRFSFTGAHERAGSYGWRRRAAGR